jgi:HSP20 family protein
VLTQASPWDSLQQLERQMEDLSSHGLTGARMGPTGPSEQLVVPPIDVFARNGDLVVRADLPGMDPARDIEIAVHDGVLVIRGERRREDRCEGEHFFRMETSYGAFQRGIALPPGVKEEEIKASYENGILEVVVPGAGQSSSPRKIPISVRGKLKDLIMAGRQQSQKR